MKDKEWLRETVQTMIDEEHRCYDPLVQQRKHTCRVIMDLIDQLEEPEKPVIPKFVADYIEKWEHEGLTMYEWFVFGNNDVDYDVNKWLYNNTNGENRRREYLLIDAIRYGYEVEKKKRYYIVDKTNSSTLMTFELSDVVGEEVIEFVYGYSENETIHFNSKEKAELIAHFVGESLEVEEATE